MTSRIQDYALLGDCQGAALVGRDGSLDWWCAPRFDSPSVFARLLDPAAGHWSIRPADAFVSERSYLSRTMVLKTTFRTPTGVLELIDALALAPGARGHDIGHDSSRVLVRQMEAVEGEVRVVMEYAPRLEYGLVTPTLVTEAAGIATVGGSAALLLAADRELTVEDSRAVGEFLLRSGESAAFALHHADAMQAHARPLDPRASIADTAAGWRSWSDLHQGYRGVYAEQVWRSGLVLQSLTYQPTGAVVAAATTSLPERVGGELNWDYRFAWLRDASLLLEAQWIAACPDEASRYFDWMARAAVGAQQQGHVQIMFGVGGERDLTERTLDHLQGYSDSRPVRVGNDAWSQSQLDVYGEVLHAAYALREQVGEFDEFNAAFLRTLADRAAKRWRDPDAGIWEARDRERHYLSSKLMCWVALDRAVRLANRIGGEEDRERWSVERDRIREEILCRGSSEEAGAYTGAFGSDRLDASVLLVPLMGFLPADDARMWQTIEAVERELAEDGLVWRWSGAEDGAFVICSYWLADCLARGGKPERACEVFDAVTGWANDVGLLSEEVDPAEGLIGNFPQAFSHVGLVNAAWSIEQATNHNERETR